MTMMTAPRHARPSLLPLWFTVKTLIAVRRQRRRLKSLDDAALRDIGISRADAAAEAARPLWDAPENWRS